MPGRGRKLSFLIESCREIEVGVQLIRVHCHGLFPGVHGLVGMSEPRGENSVIDQRIRIAREELEYFRVALVRVLIPAVLQQRQSQGLLRARIVGIDVHGSLQRINRSAAVSSLRLRGCDASLNHAVVGIHARRADESGKIGLMSAQRKANLVDAAPQKKQRDQRHAKCRG